MKIKTLLEAVGDSNWHKETLSKILDSLDIKEKNKEIIDYMAGKKKLDLISASDSIGISIGMVKGIWTKYKEAVKTSLGSNTNSESKGDKLFRQLNQQKQVGRLK